MVFEAAFRLGRNPGGTGSSGSDVVTFEAAIAAGSLIFASDNVAKNQLHVTLLLKNNQKVTKKDARLLLNDLRSLARYDTQSSPGGLFGLLI